MLILGVLQAIVLAAAPLGEHRQPVSNLLLTSHQYGHNIEQYKFTENQQYEIRYTQTLHRDTRMYGTYCNTNY